MQRTINRTITQYIIAAKVGNPETERFEEIEIEISEATPEKAAAEAKRTLKKQGYFVSSVKPLLERTLHASMLEDDFMRFATIETCSEVIL